MESRFTHDSINKHHTPWHSLSLTLNNYFPQLSPQILFFCFFPHISKFLHLSLLQTYFIISFLIHSICLFRRIKSCSFNLIDSLFVCYLWDLKPLNPSFLLCASLPSSLFPCSAVQISFLLSSFFISLLPFSLQQTRSLWSCPILIFLATSSFLFLISPFLSSIYFLLLSVLLFFHQSPIPPPFFLSGSLQRWWWCRSYLYLMSSASVSLLRMVLWLHFTDSVFNLAQTHAHTQARMQELQQYNESPFMTCKYPRQAGAPARHYGNSSFNWFGCSMGVCEWW